jgi:transposase
VRVYLAAGITDTRKGITGLAALAQPELGQNTASGALFSFRGRRRQKPATDSLHRHHRLSNGGTDRPFNTSAR